jgi:hypothetical protein
MVRRLLSENGKYGIGGPAMSNHPDSQHTTLRLQQARELMAQGQPEKALAVALVALQQSMLHLREALAALQRHLARFNAPRESSAPRPLPAAGEKKPRYYH